MNKKETQSSKPTQTPKGRSMVGKVVSTNMIKTVIVEVVRTHTHKLYKKIIRRSRRIAAHNTVEGIVEGDVVKITEVPPMSKTKHFIVVEKL